MSNEVIYETLKGLSGLRKVLAESQKLAMMSADDIENTQYNSGAAINSVEGAGANMDKAVEAIMGIATYIGKAINLSEAAKAALRQIEFPEQEPAIADGLSPQAIPQAAVPQQQGAQQPMATASRSAFRKSNALAQQRMMARKLRERTLGG